MFSSIQKIHFVGIGGIGMSGIAEILLDQGFSISGSDAADTDITRRLASLGAIIYEGHAPENIADAEVVVYSSAVKPLENPETAAAYRKGIPVIRRAEMLAEVTRLKYSIAIAGTHGKTTTTSMCGLALMKSGFDPTVIVGGKLSGLGGTNARLGKGDWTVIEADEYDRSFLQLLPTIAVITNIEEEHLDIYRNIDDLRASFAEFANKVPFYGIVALCLDDPGVMELLPLLNKRKVTYGFSPQCEVRAMNLRHQGLSSSCDIVYHGEKLGEVTLNIPGIHNMRNALGAMAAALELGADFANIKAALAEFTGVYRRFEVKGKKAGITVIDDYAHHPTEVASTLQAARTGWNGRIVAIFQPHTYTRTRDFYRAFARSFVQADIVIVTDIYAARELPIEGITGELVARTATEYGHKEVYHIPTLEEINERLPSLLQEGDMLITLGAGNVWKVGEEYLRS